MRIFILPATVFTGEMSTQKTIRQEAGSVAESALRLDTDKAEQIIDALNTELAASYVMYHQVKKHHWNVEGPEFRDLHLYLDEVAEDLELAADALAERVQAIGGVPHSTGTTFEEQSPISPEDENVYDIRTSLQNDLEGLGIMIETMRDHIALTNELGDYTTEQLLRETLEDVEEHAHHLEHYLEDDSLVLESGIN